MADIQEFIKNLSLKHMVDYDPAKAHEYYLRNRELKGLAPAVKPIPGSSKGAADSIVAKNGSKKVVRSVVSPAAKKKSTEQHRKEVDARVASLTAKLDQLRKLLATLVKQAKARGGIDTPTAKSPGAKPTAGTSNRASSSKLTTAEKADKAKKAKIEYDKEKKKDPDAKEAELKAKIAEVTAKIQDLKAKLAEARQNSTSRSVGVRANTTK